MPGDVPLVVFDVDDTLYLERDYVASGFAALEPVVRERFGISGFAAVAWRIFGEGGRGNIFDLALAELGAACTKAQVRGLVDAYRKHRPRISLLPDAREALARIRRFALLTDGPTECQRNKVRALGLAARAEIVVLTGAYGAAFGKPHPRGFQEIAERSAAGRLVYVADNPVKDFIAPRRLGWTTVRVRRPGGLHAGVAHGDDVDLVISDLSELRALRR